MKTAFHSWMLLVVVMLLGVSRVYASALLPLPERNISMQENRMQTLAVNHARGNQHLRANELQQLIAVTVPNNAENRNITWGGNNKWVTLVDDDGEAHVCKASEAETSAWSDYGRLYVTSPVKEMIEVYALTGVVVHRATKPPGETVFDLNVPRGIVIVKGSSGWVRKVKL